VEQAYALGKLMRVGLGAHSAVLPEPVEARALDGFRLPLSSIRDADLVVLLGDEPVDELAPVVGLWIRAARRRGAEVLHGLDEAKVRSATRPSTCSRSRCSSGLRARSPTSSSRERATSSATGRTSTSRDVCSACGALFFLRRRTKSPGSRSSPSASELQFRHTLLSSSTSCRH